jgi:hypothetical protein
MDKSIFDQYDYFALIVPGTVLLLWTAVMFRKTAFLGGLKDLSIGGLGVLLVLAFVAGLFAAFVGGAIEKAVQHAYGNATDRIIRGEEKPFDDSAMALVNDRMARVLKRKDALPQSKMSNAESFALGRQMYAAVSAAGHPQRLDLFNRRFGLAFGLMGAFLLCAALAWVRVGAGNVFSRRTRGPISAGFVVLAILMFFQMQSFGWTYALELFVQFMRLP